MSAHTLKKTFSKWFKTNSPTTKNTKINHKTIVELNGSGSDNETHLLSNKETYSIRQHRLKQRYINLDKHSQVVQEWLTRACNWVRLSIHPSRVSSHSHQTLEWDIPFSKRDFTALTHTLLGRTVIICTKIF